MQCNVYLHKRLCRRESPRPEEVHSNDVFQRALSIFRCKERFIGRQRRRESLPQQASQPLSPQVHPQAHLIQRLPVSCQTKSVVSSASLARPASSRFFCTCRVWRSELSESCIAGALLLPMDGSSETSLSSLSSSFKGASIVFSSLRCVGRAAPYSAVSGDAPLP